MYDNTRYAVTSDSLQIHIAFIFKPLIWLTYLMLEKSRSRNFAGCTTDANNYSLLFNNIQLTVYDTPSKELTLNNFSTNGGEELAEK